MYRGLHAGASNHVINPPVERFPFAVSADAWHALVRLLVCFTAKEYDGRLHSVQVRRRENAKRNLAQLTRMEEVTGLRRCFVTSGFSNLMRFRWAI